MVDKQYIAADEEGYIEDLDQWNENIAQAIASHEGITLTNEHWEIIRAVRVFHATFELAPAMRPLCKYIAKKLSPEKASSLHLLKLFPGSPAKLATKIAGLPRPENCL